MPFLTYSWIHYLNEQGLVKNIPGSPEGKPQIHENLSPVLGRIQK